MPCHLRKLLSSANLFQNAKAYVAPSLYEGFGLTILEGLHSRLATITLNESPMNEIVSNRLKKIKPSLTVAVNIKANSLKA